MSSPVKYAICIDALDMLCTGKIKCLHDDVLLLHPDDKYILTGDIQLKRKFKFSHLGFHFCFNILINDKIFGQVFYGNNFQYRYAHADTCQITIENHILYQANLADKLKMVLDVLELKFLKYLFMEIAIDGKGIIARSNSLTYSKKYKRKRKVRIKPELDDDTKQNIGYIIGSKQSEKHISIYEKVQEIEKSKKEYITEFWRRNGLDVNDGLTDRCELRAKDKILKSFSDDFTQLENPAYLSSFFKSVVGNYLEFYNKANPKLRKHVIDWSMFEELKITKQVNTHKAFSVNRYKSMLRNLFEEYVLTGDEQYLHTLANICARYKLMSWIYNSVPRWIREFRLNA